MTIDFHPRPGMVLICNFETGFVHPEMTKLRRVIVISPKKFNNLGTCVVVPISKSPPDPEPALYVPFAPAQYPFLHPLLPSWAKCNMIHSVSLKRLDRLRVGTEYLSPTISMEDLRSVRRAVALASGIDIDTLR